MINAIIVDDDYTCSDALKVLLTKYCPRVHILATANTIDEAIKLIGIHTPDVVFLDVEMQGELGFDLLKKISTINFEVIFTTAHEKYALKAIQTSCLDYLLKPISPEELQRTILKFEKKEDTTSNYQKIEALLSNISNKQAIISKMIIPGANHHTFVKVQDIICCKADANYTEVYTTNREKIISTKSLKEFEDTLDARLFFRCHKSWLVNIQFVKTFMKSDLQVVLINDMVVDVSVRKKDAFLNLFTKF